MPPPPPGLGPRPGFAAYGAGLVAARPPARPAVPVSEAVLRIPLRTGELVRQALDLLTRRDTGLRGASFYIGFLLLVTVAPMIVIFGLAMTLAEPLQSDPADGAWFGWLLLAAVPALLGYLAAGVEARTLATAVIGGRVEGRPLHLRESIAVARHRFWSMLGAQLLIGVVSAATGWVVRLAVIALVGEVEAVTFGASLVVSLVVSAPFVYVPAGIVLGEVGAFEAISRSWRLVRLRKSLAVVVTLFGVVSQLIVLLGLSEGIDIVARVLVGTGVVEQFPRPLVVPIAAAVVFALGTLTFLVEAIAAAPAVHAFAALTHYTNGLQDGRDRPVGGDSLLSPWVTPGLAIATLVAGVAVLGAVLSLPA